MQRKLCLLFLIAQIVLASIFPAYSATEAKRENINIAKFRDEVIKNNKELRDLKKTRNDLGNTIAFFDKNKGYILMGGDRSSGSKESREGSYYQYAYPNFVQMENLNAQVISMDVSIQTIETTLAYNADKLYLQRALVENQLKLYNQMMTTSKRQLEASELQYKMGLISAADLEKSRLNYENSIYQRDKSEFSLRRIEYSLRSLGGLDPSNEYFFEAISFNLKKFDSDEFYKYYEQAKSNSRKLYAANVNVQALENEKKFVELYKSFIIASDLQDFDFRYENGRYELEKLERDIYKSLKLRMSEYNKITDEVNVARLQLQQDENMLSKLKMMKELGQVVDIQIMEFEAKILGTKLNLLNLENEQTLIIQRLELLVDYGVEI